MKVVLGMSGGVDSSVAALLLKEQGYDVIGLFMKNWDEVGPDGECPAERDFDDVARVCEQLGIPHYSVSFAAEYQERVFKTFISEIEAGRTPNPDVLCNREIKFAAFFEQAKKLGAELVATGHYCQTERGELLKGKDPGKDQSYFLHLVPGAVLRDVLFPIGGMLKSEVRALARAHGLATQSKKDSTGICFIGERKFSAFLSQYVAAKPGPIMTLEGQRIGTHQGAAFYTLGQRKGLQISGKDAQGRACANADPWFVVDKRQSENTVVVAQGTLHPALFSRGLRAGEASWVSGQAPELPLRCRAKVRYRQQDQDCVVYPAADGVEVVFDQPQRAVTPGQSVVFYDGEKCLGGATILFRDELAHRAPAREEGAGRAADAPVERPGLAHAHERDVVADLLVLK